MAFDIDFHRSDGGDAVFLEHCRQGADRYHDTFTVGRGICDQFVFTSIVGAALELELPFR